MVDGWWVVGLMVVSLGWVMTDKMVLGWWVGCDGLMVEWMDHTTGLPA